VAHVFNNDKTYLSFNMHSENIKATYESIISGYGHRAKLLWEHLDPRMTTKEHVISMAANLKSDIIVVGMHGRKGPKA